MTTIDKVSQDSVHEQCKLLASKLWSRYEGINSTMRILVGISGIPGAGKSTIAQLVVDCLNSIYIKTAGETQPRFAVNVPMDGFHYTRQQLLQMPDPANATHRRGAAFTYDAKGFLRFVQTLRQRCSLESSSSTYVPSFDHAVKDPVSDDIEIHAETRIILIEGNYCALAREPWLSAAKLMDELWFIDVDREVVRERLARRHIASGICPDLERAHDRIKTTDFLNADDIVENMVEVQEVIRV